MVVLLVMLGFVLYVHYKRVRQLRYKLYNFKKAPKDYIDDDSFINVREL